jgi:hypothetical protein
MGVSVIPVEDVWLWGEMASLDITLRDYDAVLHSY